MKQKIIFIYIFVVIILILLTGYKQYKDVIIDKIKTFISETMKPIILPKEAHNTIGEIPIVEHFDDGDLGGKPGYKVMCDDSATCTTVQYVSSGMTPRFIYFDYPQPNGRY